MSGEKGDYEAVLATRERHRLRRLEDGDYRLWISAETGGLGFEREFRLTVGHEASSLALTAQSSDRRLGTRSPGWFWLFAALLVGVAVIALGLLTHPLSSALVRAGLAADIWGVVMLSWPLFLREIGGTPGMMLGGGRNDGDNSPRQRIRDRAAVLTRLAVLLLVSGFALQILGQSI